VIAELRYRPLSPPDVWLRFQMKLSSTGLNIKNNPLAPKGTQFTQDGQTLSTTKDSAIELANKIGKPLVQWVRCGLQENRADEIYMKLRSITGVGEKIASLFLRDVACRYRIFPTDSRWLLQPIDTWVRRSAAFFGASGSDKAIAEFIVQMAENETCEPERIDQGMWYFGSEVAGSEYRLTQALANLSKAEDLLKRHQHSLLRAARTDFFIVRAVHCSRRRSMT
jgi:hypothetical protein